MSEQEWKMPYIDFPTRTERYPLSDFEEEDNIFGHRPNKQRLRQSISEDVHASKMKFSEGVKYDTEKPRYDLIPPEALESLAKILTFGAEKYGAHNWEYGMDWHRPYAAAQRHMWAWWNGEDNDPETGESHLDHALCCVAFLLTYEKRGVGTDDRWRKDD